MSSAESPAVICVRPSVHSSWYAAEPERAHEEQLAPVAAREAGSSPVRQRRTSSSVIAATT